MNVIATNLDEQLAALAAEHCKAYVALAWKVAKAERFDPKAIGPTCAKAERTLDDFRRLVARMVARIEAAAKLIEADKERAAANRVSERIGPLNAEIDEVNREFSAKLRALQSQRSQVIADATTHGTRATALREEAMNVLRNTAEDPAADADVIRDLHFVAIEDSHDVAAKPASIVADKHLPHYGPNASDYPKLPQTFNNDPDYPLVP